MPLNDNAFAPDKEQYPHLSRYTQRVKPPARKVEGREREMNTVLAGMERPELSNVILLGEAGSGKALFSDTPIAVNDRRGYVPIGKLKTGDYVFSDEGKPTKVIGVYPQGERYALKITFSDGSDIICDREHLWNVTSETLRGIHKKMWVTLKTEEMMDYKKLFIPPSKPLIRPDAEDFILPPYEMGFLQGLSNHDIHDAKTFLASGGHLNRKVSDYIDYLIEEDIREIGKEYVLCSLKQKQEFIKGMEYAKKYYEYPSLYIHDEYFMEDFKVFTDSMGLRFVFPYEDLRPYLLNRKVNGSLKPYSPEIVSIEDLNEKLPMTCIYVDAPSHLFTAGLNHVITHNTTLMQGLSMLDSKRLYLEVDLAKMIADIKTDTNEMATKLKDLFSEVTHFGANEGREIVLFIDEVHQVVQLSDAAVEALKPLLADSATRGIRVVFATTFIEFRKWIQPNQPLVERLQRVNLSQPDRETTVNILKSMATKYGVRKNDYLNDSVYDLIYEYTQRYIPANSQPRKSILILDAMIGYHRKYGKKVNKELLTEVLFEIEGINTAFRVDALKIRDQLNARVYSQEFATKIIERRLQICVADLNNKDKPMSSFLFTGSTGVGKSIRNSEIIPVYDKSGKINYKRNGDLKPGDYVYNRYGKPVEVTGVFPQGELPVYEFEFTDGRKLKCSGEHLWTYKSRFGNGSKYWKTVTAEELMEKDKDKYYAKGRTARNVKFVIPMNEPCQYSRKDFKVHPYVMGAFIGNGCMTESALTLSSGNSFVPQKCSALIGAEGSPYLQKGSYNYNFIKNSDASRNKRFSTCDIFPELYGKYSIEKYIPEEYKYGSVEQRWELIQGLFDTDGSIRNNDRYNVSYSSSSEKLVKDIQYVLWSLGISSSIKSYERKEDFHKNTEYELHVKIGNPDKKKFFTYPEKLEIAEKAETSDKGKKRVKKFNDVLGIREIRKLDYKEDMTCIMVDDPEHLYQAGDFIVTHNTEMTKALAAVLFDDERRLIRFDMTEYANDDSLNHFRHELTNRVWERPYSIVLLDEVEKACSPVTRLLLQVLDDGRLIDENNREVPFTNAYIILTTNAGSEIYKTIAQYASDDTGSGKQMVKYDKIIRQSIISNAGESKFPPELLGRIDAIVPFQPLSSSTQLKIVRSRLEKLKTAVNKMHGVMFNYDDRVVNYLVFDHLDTDSNAGGARAAISKLETEVTSALAAHINENPQHRYIYASIGGEMMSENKNILESTAYVELRGDVKKSYGSLRRH